MFTNNLPRSSYGLCIIGSGPAGIMLALEYAKLNPDEQVLLLEYGTRKGSGTNQLDKGIEIKTPLNHHPTHECTNKGFGGTSASWGGRCVMFDEIDFMERPVLKGACTWDLALYHQLHKYLQRSADYFECGKAVFSLHNNPDHSYKPYAEGFAEGVVTDSLLERWSKPTRFGKRYAARIAASANIAVVEACEARTFGEPDSRGEVTTLQVRSVNSGEWGLVRAKVFVLAAGAQESTRLLLRNRQLFNRLNAVPAALGKYYQGHISGKIASIKFTGKPGLTDFGFARDADGTYVRRRFQFSTQYLLKEDLLNAAMWLDNPLYYNPNHRSGAMSFMYLAMIMPILGKKLAPPAIAHAVTGGEVQGISRHLLNILKDLPASLHVPANLFFKRYCLERKLPGVFLYSPLNQYALHFHAEQLPCESNRMVLAADGESLEIYYTLQDAEIASVIRLHETLDTWLRKCKCGWLEYWYPKEALAEAIRNMSRDGIHQCGTSRIAKSPQLGVVDEHLKLWGTSNVYVCSSSVFPTSGQANPTFLLGAFAVRLAEHLSSIRHQQHAESTALSV